jgi:SAM-dependent methyltransferase
MLWALKRFGFDTSAFAGVSSALRYLRANGFCEGATDTVREDGRWRQGGERMKETIGSAFQDIDRSSDPSYWIAFLDALSDREEIRSGRRQALETMALREGGAVLDVGSGAGDMLLQLSIAVGASGRALGVDLSRAMAAEARRRVIEIGLRAEVCLTDASSLPFADGTFDACYIERVLCHVASPTAVIAELVRVLKPSGLVAAQEPDLTASVVDLPDSEVVEKVRRWRADRRTRNPRIGSQLPRRLAEAGLTAISVSAVPLLIRGRPPKHLENGERLCARQACDEGLISEDEARRYLSLLDETIAAERWFSMILMFLVMGRKP